MAEYDRYINLPGFDNVNRALTLFNVPVDLYRQGDGSVDAIANPDNLPMRERIGRGIESLVGTAAYGLAPVLARFGGQKAAQAIPEIFTGFGGPQAAEEVVKDVVQDPSRRNFLAGAAATVPVAALAPDVITDVVTKAAKTGSRAPINPINMAMANIRALKGQIDEKYQILDEAAEIEIPNADAMKIRDDAEVFIDRSETEIFNEVREVLDEIDPSFFKTASDDALEEIASHRYDPQYGFSYYEIDKMDNLPNFKILIDEAKRRGLHTAKNAKGIDEFPNLRTLVEDFTTESTPSFLNVNPSMQMVRKADFADDYLKENVQKINDENIENIIQDGRIEKKSTEEINKNIVRYAEQNNIPAPRRAFDNPKVEYISTKEIADNIAQFNYPRYDVGKFGGDLPSGNLNENPQFLEQFEKSGQETLKENIFNEGIKEPIEIELVLSNGEISIGQGHHRLQAAIELNLPEVPVIVKTKENPRPVSAAVMKPGRVNTSGLENYTDYSYSELNLADRFIAPKETPDEIQRRGGSGFLDPETGEFTDRRSPRFYTPMRQGFFRSIDRKADGGSVQGIGSLSDTARDMFRGPRGIGSYQQFMSG
tara:strand:- start:286 stop:2070 length:1785 start_codon:yes stop_codon:yes gene_type:complete